MLRKYNFEFLEINFFFKLKDGLLIFRILEIVNFWHILSIKETAYGVHVEGVGESYSSMTKAQVLIEQK